MTGSTNLKMLKDVRFIPTTWGHFTFNHTFPTMHTRNQWQFRLRLTPKPETKGKLMKWPTVRDGRHVSFERANNLDRVGYGRYLTVFGKLQACSLPYIGRST